jgi:PKD domain
VDPLRKHAVVGLAVTSLCSALLAVTPAFAAQTPAVQAAQPNVVSAVPAKYTPDVNNGVVYSIGQVGSTVFIGGTFTSVSPNKATTTFADNYIAAFTAGTGVLNTGFAPTLDGAVQTIIPGPTAGTVYIGGDFKTVDGVKARIALLNASTGALVPGWRAPAINAKVTRLVLSGGQLYVGGYFSTVNALPRNGLATLNPTTGAVNSYFTLPFTGHHNYLTQCNPRFSTCADAAVGVKAFDINPAGTEMVAIGNFTSVAGLSRDQIAVINLGPTAPTVNATWATQAFTAECSANAFDSYIRDVQFSPDGSYFVVVATGASGTNLDGTNSSCDSASRYEATGTGTNIRPTWIDYTGRDSLWSVAVTGTAVYVGGHERWLNNTKGLDGAQEGAVPRPGVAAMDPTNGLPLAWNPGRNPRGAGAYSLLATSDGLYVGSDTDWIGNSTYHHKKIAFFPLAGGKTLAANANGTLPGDVDLVGGSSAASGVRSVHWDGVSAPGTPATLTTTGADFTTARGAFDLNGTVYYGSTDGNFYERSFDGKIFGPAVAIDPYDDPTWSTVKTGSGQTYRGVKSSFYGELPSLTSMFYNAGRLYYTLSGQTAMRWRWFEPDSGIVGADEFTLTDGMNWSHVAGAFLVGSTLYFADSISHSLSSVPFTNGQAAGTPVVVDSTINWASDGAFVVSQANINDQPPVPAFTANCPVGGTSCTFDATGSTDPDGVVTSYAWTFGDGGTAQDTTGAEAHAYATTGAYPVTLTATDNDGVSASVTHTEYVGVTPPPAIGFGGVATKYGNAASESVTIPATTAAGDGLLLFDTYASATTTASAPTGWTLVGSAVKGSDTTAVYQRVAIAGDAGTAVSVAYSATVKATLTVADYTGTSTADPVESAASASNVASASDPAPALTGLADNSYVLSYWSDRSSATTTFTPPASVTQRSATLGTGAATINTVFADSGAPVSGTYAARTATTNDASSSSVSWTIALAQATL